MKRKILGVSMVSLGIVASLLSWDKFVALFYVIGQLPEREREKHFAIAGQGFFYFIVSLLISVFGLSLLFGLGGQKFKTLRIAFFTMVTIWFALEIPIHKCEFYGINHSFWKSKTVHFH